MPFLKPNTISKTLHVLKSSLHDANQAWTVDDYEELVRFYVEIVPRLLEAEHCGIFVANLDTGNILSKVGTGISDGEITAPFEGSAVGHAISTGRCVVENNLVNRTGFHRMADAKTGFVTRTLACAPIRSVTDKQIIGAIQVLNKRHRGVFTEEDEKILQRVADYLSVALDNILLYPTDPGFRFFNCRRFGNFRSIKNATEARRNRVRERTAYKHSCSRRKPHNNLNSG